MTVPASDESTEGLDDSRPESPSPEALRIRVLEVLEMIRPAVQEDGGDFELVEVMADGTVRIRFLGACIDCPSREITLRDGIARHLRDRIPEVTSVISVD